MTSTRVRDDARARTHQPLRVSQPRFGAFVFLVVAVAVLAACGPTVTSGGAPTDRTVVMGDSNVWLTSDASVASFGADGVQTDGHPGYGACDSQNEYMGAGPGYWQAEIARYAADPTVSRFELQLGLNDLQGVSPQCIVDDSYDSVIDSVVAAAGGKPVLWAGYRTDFPGCVQPRVGTQNLCVLLNARLQSATSRNANMQYLDEAAQFNGKPQDFLTNGSSCHFSVTGALEFGPWLHQQIAGVV